MLSRSIALPTLLVLLVATIGTASAQVVGAGRVGAPPQRPSMPGAEAKAATGTASIKGRVVAADTGRPLRRAQIRVNAPELGTGMGKNVSTDLDGYYEIAELPAGRYTINVTRGGYLPMQHGMRRFGEPGAPLQVGDGEAHGNVNFTLARASTISGRLTDEGGQPVGGAVMWAMRVQYFQGERRLVPVSSPGISTDETGRFRIQGMPPGDFYVVATSRETWVDDKDPSITYGFSPSYHPGTAVAAEAQRVRVGVGQDVASIDFSLVPARAATLSGIALAVDGTPSGAASIGLTQEVRGPSSVSMSMLGSARANPDGTWRLERVLPGEYILRATMRGPDGRSHSTTMPVLVTGTDVEGIVVAADAGALVTGEVQGDDGLALPTGALRVNVFTVPPSTSGLPLGADDGLVREDGTFSRRAPSGRVMVSVAPLPPGWALKSVEIAGQNHAGRLIELRGGAQLEGVKVVLTNRFPALTGMLTDERGAPAEGTVVLFPQDQSSWLDGTGAIRSTRPDQAGQYRFAAVRPGDYYLIALDAVPSWQVNDPEFLSTLTGEAARLTLREGQAQTQNLEVRR